MVELLRYTGQHIYQAEIKNGTTNKSISPVVNRKITDSQTIVSTPYP